jgi:hypothetical protein
MLCSLLLLLLVTSGCHVRFTAAVLLQLLLRG